MSQETLPCFSSIARSMVIGSVYEHYSRGIRYKILAVARDHETLEELIVYQAMYGEGDVWVRPLSMFLETVTVNGQIQPRFKLVEAGF